MNNKIYVAKLGKAVGLKGYLKLFMDTDFPEQFKKGAIFSTNKKLELIVEEYSISRKLIKFNGFDDIDSAKKLTNQLLFVSEESTKENCILEEDEYFWFDIIACKIVENGQELGIVKDIHRYPLYDYLEIITSKKFIEKSFPKTFLIPYNKDKYIVKVDIVNKIIETKYCFEILENS